jgi:hypothetical protein
MISALIFGFDGEDFSVIAFFCPGRVLEGRPFGRKLIELFCELFWVARVFIANLVDLSIGRDPERFALWV